MPSKKKITKKEPTMKINSSIKKSLLAQSPKFSNRQYALLAAALVLFGILVIFLTRATSLILTTVEAETLTAPSGATVIGDSLASSSKALKFTSNGSASGPFSLPAGSESFTVRAKGVVCNGAPQMVVKIDGVQAQTVNVNSSGWAEYPGSARLASGTHSITVSFTNDYTQYAGNSGNVKCDRDLFVDKITFTASSGDVSPPTPAVLTATPGDQLVSLSWTAATDDVGVTRYEVWRDTTYVKGLDSSARSYAVTGLANGTVYNFRVVAYDAAGRYANSNIVPATPTPGSTTPPPPVTSGCSNPAPFPSRLKAQGRNLIDENGCVMPKLKGFNIHASTSPGDTWVWEDAHFKDISANGGRVLRTVIKWNAYESTQGYINETNLQALDKHIARAQRNGIYVILDLHLNVGAVPSWTTSGNDETEKYAIYGQKITQTLAQRYSVARAADGMTINPKTVLGFNLNEPPQDATTINGNNSIPTFESQQRQMISWFRGAGAQDWIGFVSLAYANQKPYLAAPRISADPNAYDSVGGNVVFDAHDYLVYNDSTDPNTDSRQSNGVLADTRYFNPGAHWLALADPHSFPSDATLASRATAQMKAFLKPFDTYATAAQMPLMIGEFGWNGSRTGGTGKSGYYSAKREAMASVGPAIELHWLYGTNLTNDPWVAKSGTTWDPDVLAWLKSP